MPVARHFVKSCKRLSVSADRGGRRFGLGATSRHEVLLRPFTRSVLGILAEHRKRSRVEASIALVVDPVKPCPARGDLLAGGAQRGIGAELRRGADGGVVALARAILFLERGPQAPDSAVMFMACHRGSTSCPSLGDRTGGRGVTGARFELPPTIAARSRANRSRAENNLGRALPNALLSP